MKALNSPSKVKGKFAIVIYSNTVYLNYNGKLPFILRKRGSNCVSHPLAIHSPFRRNHAKFKFFMSFIIQTKNYQLGSLFIEQNFNK